MKLARGSGSWIGAPLVLGMVFLMLALFGPSESGGEAPVLISRILPLLALFSFALAFFLCIFFRDPERRTGKGIVSPADGIVVEISEENDPEANSEAENWGSGDENRDRKRWKVVKVFMNIHNVHVNRCPIDGKVLSMKESGGGFLPAYKKAADMNRRVETVLDTAIGRVRIVQVAGFLVRRIVPYIHNGQCLSRGERIGIVRFGSRVDLYLPADKAKIIVKKNDKVLAGSTTVAVVADV